MAVARDIAKIWVRFLPHLPPLTNAPSIGSGIQMFAQQPHDHVCCGSILCQRLRRHRFIQVQRNANGDDLGWRERSMRTAIPIGDCERLLEPEPVKISSTQFMAQNTTDAWNFMTGETLHLEGGNTRYHGALA